MILAEFKAWLDGYTDEMSGPPTADQWAKIRAKIAETVVFKPDPPKSPYGAFVGAGVGIGSQARCDSPPILMQVT